MRLSCFGACVILVSFFCFLSIFAMSVLIVFAFLDVSCGWCVVGLHGVIFSGIHHVLVFG